jgi:hypothetical protein
MILRKYQYKLTRKEILSFKRKSGEVVNEAKAQQVPLVKIHNTSAPSGALNSAVEVFGWNST